jgi:protein TonB
MKFSVQPARDLPLLIFVSAVAVMLLTWLTPPELSNAREPRAEEHYGPARSHATANLPGLFSSDDYPEEAMRRDEQGTVAYTLAINPRGSVSNCVIARSSGSAALDTATCTVLQQRAHFIPARDGSGRPVADLHSGRIRWVLPD